MEPPTDPDKYVSTRCAAGLMISVLLGYLGFIAVIAYEAIY